MYDLKHISLAELVEIGADQVARKEKREILATVKPHFVELVSRAISNLFDYSHPQRVDEAMDGIASILGPYAKTPGLDPYLIKCANARKVLEQYVMDPTLTEHPVSSSDLSDWSGVKKTDVERILKELKGTFVKPVYKNGKVLGWSLLSPIYSDPAEAAKALGQGYGILYCAPLVIFQRTSSKWKPETHNSSVVR